MARFKEMFDDQVKKYLEAEGVELVKVLGYSEERYDAGCDCCGPEYEVSITYRNLAGHNKVYDYSGTFTSFIYSLDLVDD